MAARRVLPVALATVLALGVAVPVAASADSPPVSGGTLVDQCQANVGPVPEAGPRACRTGQSVVWGTAAACRTPLRDAPAADAPEQCAVIDGRPVSVMAFTVAGGRVASLNLSDFVAHQI